ncbi:hypothetical protein RM780_27370 [Streptomyces sp. DSM 44917]|uniref:Uncharacterized protein n=1 Tax=Streptomyces boetiae TaxID=3075541 RepID=A0ABU2LGC3_9ACTN|nr:hypothetical protein [Streptomyces sp. DSM 44917]MDT0310637.1 hypothetical protein [Streptomyces sp. DSM 44917]
MLAGTGRRRFVLGRELRQEGDDIDRAEEAEEAQAEEEMGGPEEAVLPGRAARGHAVWAIAVVCGVSVGVAVSRATRISGMSGIVRLSVDMPRVLPLRVGELAVTAR